MEKSEDVERLFSWIRAPMVQYREFAPQVEVAEAVATWPLVHQTAVKTGLASADEASPHGDALAHQRIAREKMGMPELAAKAIHDAPVPGMRAIPTANEPHAMPSSDRLVAALGQRVQAARVERAQGIAQPAFAPPPPETRPAALVTPPPAAPPVVTPVRIPEATSPAPEVAMSGFQEPATAAPSGPRLGMTLRDTRPREEIPTPRQTSAAAAPSYRGALFKGEYRQREETALNPEAPPPERAPNRQAEPQNNSLNAVFGRLAGPRERDRQQLPDPRSRSRTSPGLGGVFDRLR